MDANGIINNLINSLSSAREREILRRRFGLQKRKQQTLQEVGDYYNLTRERIRQLESRALSQIKEPKKYKPILNYINKFFNTNNKILTEEKVLDNFSDLKSICLLILHLDDNFIKFCDNKNFKCHWATDHSCAKKARKSIINLINYLEKRGEPISATEVAQYANQNYLEISKLINKNPFNSYGLINWPEITPRGVKDKAYLILKQEEKPLHFTQVTEKINQVDFCDGKKAFCQTVHNELIKDPRFSLEGRGTYGLAN